MLLEELRPALFWALIVSLSVGLPGVVAPSLDRVVPEPCETWSRFGFPGSFSRRALDLVSNADIILHLSARAVLQVGHETYPSALSGHTRAKTQYVPRMLSLTPGLGSAKPFLMHFSISSSPPPCSMALLCDPCLLIMVLSQPVRKRRGWTFLS